MPGRRMNRTAMSTKTRPVAWWPCIFLLCWSGTGSVAMAADVVGEPAAAVAKIAEAAATSPITGMLPMNDAELADAAGRQGILLDIAVRNNVDAANNPIGCTPSVGTPNPCRLGLQFVGRETVWLMFKEFYGTLNLKDIQMDVAFLPTTNSGFRNTARFQDSAGVCLIPLVGGICTPEGYFALGFRYPQAAARTPGTYADLTSFLNVGRIALEFNVVGPPVVEGYMRDTSLNSVVSLRMSDSGSVNGAAQMRVDGNAYLYGF